MKTISKLTLRYILCVIVIMIVLLQSCKNSTTEAGNNSTVDTVAIANAYNAKMLPPLYDPIRLDSAWHCIDNYQKSHPNVQQSSWLVKTTDMDDLMRKKPQLVHIFLGQKDFSNPDVITLILIPVNASGKHEGYFSSTNTTSIAQVTEYVTPCPQCISPIDFNPVTYTSNSLNWMLKTNTEP